MVNLDSDGMLKSLKSYKTILSPIRRLNHFPRKNLIILKENCHKGE